MTSAASRLLFRGSIRNISFLWGHHDQEFTDLENGPALEYLLDVTDDIRLQLDLGWAGVAGYEPLSFLKAHADRIGFVHLKDYDDTGETVEVGEGDLDIEVTVELVRVGIDWLIYDDVLV